ncbi:MAG: hypothetical protein OXB92_17285, partial [Acidimicrobiaceae bacterium]|nr:hypothetical protein [Acidimicrobiaceae bacterium]
MRFPWQRRPVERRTYTEDLVAALASQTEGATVEVGKTAAVEAAAGFIARALASSTVEGDVPPGTITPTMLHAAGRGLVRDGEALFVLRMVGAGFRFVEAASWDWSGGYDPTTWICRADLPGPTLTTTVRVDRSEVAFFQWSARRGLPHRGTSA